MAEKRCQIYTIALIYSSFLLFLFILGLGNASAQPISREESGPQIRLGNVTFKIREVQSTPSNLSLLEIYIEIINRGQEVAPPNSIKVALVTKEVKFSPEHSGEKSAPSVEETTIGVPLPPRSWRIQIFGLEIPKEKPESITFEVQINPPDGEKKTVSFNF